MKTTTEQRAAWRLDALACHASEQLALLDDLDEAIAAKAAVDLRLECALAILRDVSTETTTSESQLFSGMYSTGPTRTASRATEFLLAIAVKP